MNRKNFIYLAAFLILLFSGIFSCKEDNEEKPTSVPPELPLFTEGQMVNSDFYENDVLREQMIDTVVNFGTSAAPALFYVNQQHTLDGAPIAVGNTYSNIFRSLTRQDHYDFIVLWGQIMGININPNDTSAAAIARRQEAFHMLQTYLMSSDIDFPLLIALSKDVKELQCAKKWVDAASSLETEGIELAKSNTLDHIFRTMEISGNKISDLSTAVQSAGMTEKDFLLLLQKKGIDPEKALLQFDSPRQIITGLVAMALVALGTKMFASWTLRFIQNGNAKVNLENEYASYVNDNDTNVMDYYTRKDTISPTYKVAYCTLATAEFFIETYYDAYHISLPGQYISRVGMMVKSVHCSWGMHVEGSTVFDLGQDIGPEGNPVSYSTGTVTVKYGDCCCNKRKGVLHFQVSGNNGYKQVSWSHGK